jgi:hypothetical protein
MRHDMKTPCAECPYVGKWKGWIGDHESAQEFVDLVKADQPFPCHMSLNQDGDESIPEQVEDGAGQQCAGYAMFMSKMCKLSRNPAMAAMQNRLRAEKPDVEVLWPPDKMVEHHDSIARKR